MCKVDVEGCADIAEGECVVICQDSNSSSPSGYDSCSTAAGEGVNKLVAMDDNLLWTATGSSSIKRWRVPSRRAVRAAAVLSGSGGAEEGDTYTEHSPVDLATEFSWHPNQTQSATPTRSSSYSHSQSPSKHLLSVDVHSNSPSPPSTSAGPRTSLTLSVTDPSGLTLTAAEREGEETWYGIPFESLVKLTSPHESFSGFGTGMTSRGRDPEIATLYSAASVMSVPRLVRSPLQSVFQVATSGPNNPRSTSPINSETMHSIRPEETLHPLRTARIEYEERDVASDATPLDGVPDEVIHGDHGLVRSAILNDRLHALTVDTAGEVAVWDLVRGVCVGRFTCDDIASASFCGSTKSGGASLCETERDKERDRDRSPREALETVRERIEGEAVVASWASVDTKTGLLTVHLSERCFEAEIYADEAGFSPDRHFGDEMRSRCLFASRFHRSKYCYVYSQSTWENGCCATYSFNSFVTFNEEAHGAHERLQHRTTIEYTVGLHRCTSISTLPPTINAHPQIRQENPPVLKVRRSSCRHTCFLRCHRQ